MQDIRGREVKVNDEIVYPTQYGSELSLIYARVIAVSDPLLHLEIIPHAVDAKATPTQVRLNRRFLQFIIVRAYEPPVYIADYSEATH